MSVTISGTNGIDKVAANSVESGDIAAGAVSQTNLASGLSGNGPAFSAYRNAAQTGIATATYTKVQFNTEDFDTANCFDATTNYRFTPNVAGYYQLSALTVWGNLGAAAQVIIQIYKNGLQYRQISNISNYTTSYPGPSGSITMYMNGTTDYVEVYVYQNSGSNGSVVDGNTWFQGCLVRAA